VASVQRFIFLYLKRNHAKRTAIAAQVKSVMMENVIKLIHPLNVKVMAIAATTRYVIAANALQSLVKHSALKTAIAAME
jgi:hypothetical protein